MDGLSREIVRIMDEDGYIRITGRNKDIIIRGGENIPVAYVENVLYEHRGIMDAQIIACLIQDCKKKHVQSLA